MMIEAQHGRKFSATPFDRAFKLGGSAFLMLTTLNITEAAYISDWVVIGSTIIVAGGAYWEAHNKRRQMMAELWRLCGWHRKA
ncbi:hypothetical protein [Paracoccus fontiphilus]|uniref:Uncharacterized protein n=1 Tax=Paracoccus fontiphilus TaxID=1815556 RepID=A0ABV7IDN3_9RHOB|nr:hypothetical protein [Paracoccus fontiphilus]